MIGCAIVGMGSRGLSFARRLGAMRDVEVRWVVDPSDDRRARAIETAGPAARGAASMDAILADPALTAVFVTAPDAVHADLAVGALGAGKNVFLEKPLATTPDDARRVLEAWRLSGRTLRLGYVLREAAFFKEIRAAIVGGRLGRIRSIRLADDLGLVHGASYRRRWHGRSANTGGLIVHKGCHDLDLICWLLDTRPTTLASFGGCELFDRPAPAPYCSACPERAACAYADAGAYEARTPAETADPTAFGLDRCVYGREADIVDNQVIAFDLSDGARGVYTLAMRNPGRSERRIAILGDRGRLDGVFERGVYDLVAEDGRRVHHRRPAGGEHSGHGGGDVGVLRGFIEACAEPGDWSPAAAADALRGVAFAFAAEESRRRGETVTLGPDLSVSLRQGAEQRQGA